MEYWLKELQESMDRCTGPCDIIEILLKMALNTIQSINQLTNQSSKDSPFDSEQLAPFNSLPHNPDF